MIWKRLWNIVVAEIFRARHYCLSCGRKMKRIPAVEERYVYVARGRLGGDQKLSSYGCFAPKSGERRIEVTPVCDVAETAIRESAMAVSRSGCMADRQVGSSELRVAGIWAPVTRHEPPRSRAYIGPKARLCCHRTWD